MEQVLRGKSTHVTGSGGVRVARSALILIRHLLRERLGLWTPTLPEQGWDQASIMPTTSPQKSQFSAGIVHPLSQTRTSGQIRTALNSVFFRLPVPYGHGRDVTKFAYISKQRSWR